MHAVFHSVPPHPIVQPEPIIEPIIPPLISEMSDILYTQASDQDELINSFQSLAKNITESAGLIQYLTFIYSISYVDQKIFQFFMESNLPESICSILDIEMNKNAFFRKDEIDDQFFLMIQRCALPFTQMIINDNKNAFLLENAIIKAKLKKSIHLLCSIHISIRLNQWISDPNRDAQTLQIILSSLRKIKASAVPIIIATEIARSLVIVTFLFQTLSSSDLYLVRRDLVICLAKLLIYHPNSFANSSTIECLNYLNDHDIYYQNMNINTTNSKPFSLDGYKNKHFIVALPALDALRIPEKVPLNSILQQIRLVLFSANTYDLNNLLNIAAISLSSQSAIIQFHPEIVNLEEYHKVFFGRCLSIDTASRFIKFEKTPKNIIELAAFLRSPNITKKAQLNALSKDLDSIINVVYMSIKRLPRISTDFQTIISSAKIISFFISHVTSRKLIRYGILKHSMSLTPQSKLFSFSPSLFCGSDDVKSMAKKIKKKLFKENFISLLPNSFTFISELIADLHVASPFFPHFINNSTFSSSCCPESLLLLSSFEELAKSLALHPQDFVTVLLNTNATPGRVKLLTVALKSVINCHVENKSKKKKKNDNPTGNDNNNNNDDDSDDDIDFDDDFDCINNSLFVDEETVEVWKRMIKVNLCKVCQFGLSILKIPSEITCKIAADFYLSLVTFISNFLTKEKHKDKEDENSTKKKSAFTSGETDSHFSFTYDDLYAILSVPMNMFISVYNTLDQIDPLCNPRNMLFFLGFIERIVSSKENPDLSLDATVSIPKESLATEDGEQKESENENSLKFDSEIKLKTKVNASAIVKSFFTLNGPRPFWGCLIEMMNVTISSLSGLLAARVMKIIALISDFSNTLQVRLSIAQRLVIDVLHHSIITSILDMLNKMTIENFEQLPLHEKCLLSLAMSELLLSWCNPLPLTAFVASRVSSDLFDLIEKLSFSISDSINNFTTIKKADNSTSQILTTQQKQSLVFENSVLDILKTVKEHFDFVITQDYDDDLVNAQQSIPPENIVQKLSGLFFDALESAINDSD